MNCICYFHNSTYDRVDYRGHYSAFPFTFNLVLYDNPGGAWVWNCLWVFACHKVDIWTLGLEDLLLNYYHTYHFIDSMLHILLN